MTERLIEEISQSYTTPAMQWGIEHEENALREYEFIYDTNVTRCGFIPHPKMEMAGASPDGLIGEDGLIEVKCPQSTTHLRFFMYDEIKPEYHAQLQFQMACTGRKWCDFMSYNPNFVGKSTGLRMKIKRILRDEKHIEEINKAVEIFLGEIEQEMQKILTKAA